MTKSLTTVCVTDLHGAMDTLQALLKKVDTHLKGASYELICLGDTLDRGPKSREVVEWLMTNKIRTCAGNHEDLCLAYSEHAKMGYKAKCARYYDRNVWLHNGGDMTLNSWGPKTKALPRDVLDWFASLPPYIIVNQESEGRKLLCAHTGYALDADKGNWMRALWGRYQHGDGDWVHDTKGVPVDDGLYRVFGHSRVDEAVVTPSWANIDTGAAYGGSLTAFIWPTKEIITQIAID